MTFTEYTVLVSSRKTPKRLTKTTDRWKYAEEFASDALGSDPSLDTVLITLEKVEQDDSGEPIREPKSG
jgi:hypothetical protein